MVSKTSNGIPVKFTLDREVLDHNDEVVESFEEGKVYKLSQASADRWVKRGAATYETVDDKPVKNSATRSRTSRNKRS